jgi:hypothetical protein
MLPEPDQAPVRPRPRKRAPVAPLNGHAAEPFARDPVEPTDVDLEDWQRGAAALARMPARLKLELTTGIAELRTSAQAALDESKDYVDRLRYEPEEMLASGIGARLGARVLAMVSTDPPPPMLIGHLDPLGHSILYGTGGVGKGTLSAMWIVELLKADKRVLILDYENHPDEWARRIAGIGGPAMLDRVLHVGPLTAAWGGKRGALWAQAEDIRQLAIEFGADYVVIDSIVPACAGSDPLKPESVSLYAGALEFIGLPVLSLAHVTKADDLRYPFGSIFWHNLSRTTYSLKADAGVVILQHRKHNNYAPLQPQKVAITFDKEGVPVDVGETSFSEHLSRRISEVMVGHHGMTIKEIVAALHELDPDDEADPPKPDTIGKALRRGLRAQPPKFAKAGEQWSNVA